VLEVRCRWTWVVSGLQNASACSPVTTQVHQHLTSNTQKTKNETTSVVIQQHSRKLLMMDILMSETCWVYKKQNKIASDIKLVFYSSALHWVGFRQTSRQLCFLRTSENCLFSLWQHPCAHFTNSFNTVLYCPVNEATHFTVYFVTTLFKKLIIPLSSKFTDFDAT